MESVVYLVPAKWVSESVLTGITGLKKNTIKTVREQCWMEGRKYKHVSADGIPMDNSQCFYNWKEIEKWIDRQPEAKKRRFGAKTSKTDC